MIQWQFQSKLYDGVGGIYLPIDSLCTCGSISKRGLVWFKSNNITDPINIPMFFIQYNYSNQTHIVTDGESFSGVLILNNGLVHYLHYRLIISKQSITNIINNYLSKIK